MYSSSVEMMASEENDVAPQNTTESSGCVSRGDPAANIPQDQAVLYRVSTDVEYASRYVKEVDNKLMQFTGKVPEAEQYYALKVRSPFCELAGGGESS